MPPCPPPHRCRAGSRTRWGLRRSRRKKANVGTNPLTPGDRGCPRTSPGPAPAGSPLALLVEPIGEDALDRSSIRVGVGLGRALRDGGLLARLRLRGRLARGRAGRLRDAALEEVGRARGGVPALRER